MDSLDREIINRFQGGVPIVDRPFQAMAEQLNVSENDVMTRISRMLEDGTLTRFGPLYNIDRMGGTFSLCAMQIPESQFDNIAEKVNDFPEVAHNYARTHQLNMWFVIAAETPPQLDQIIQRIEQETGFKVYNFPKQHEFYVNLQLSA